MDTKADHLDKPHRQNKILADCSETKPDVSLNMTGDSIEGYNFFTDSSYENGRDLLCILEEACELPVLPTVPTPSNQKPPSNDFINLKKKKTTNSNTNPKPSVSSPKKKEDRPPPADLRETPQSGVKRKPTIIRQTSIHSSTKKQSSSKKPATDSLLKSHVPIPIFLGMGKNPNLFAKNIQQLRTCKSNLLFAEPVQLAKTDPAADRHRISSSNRERDMQQDYAHLCQMVRENLRKTPQTRESAKPRPELRPKTKCESQNNLHQPLQDIDTNREAAQPLAQKTSRPASKDPKRLEVFANLQHLFQTTDAHSPVQLADRHPRDIRGSTDKLSADDRFEIFDFGLKSELDKIKTNLDKMISRVSSQKTIHTLPKKERSLDRTQSRPAAHSDDRAAVVIREKKDAVASRENSLGISPSKKGLRKTMHSASQARFNSVNSKEKQSGQEYFQTHSNSKKRLHLLPRAFSNQLLLACSSRESLNLNNTNHFLYKGSCNSTKQLVSTGSWVKGMCSIEERPDARRQAPVAFSRESSKEKTARLIKLDANSIRRLSQKYLHNREKSKEPAATQAAVSKVVSKSKELLGVLKSQSSSLDKAKSSLAQNQPKSGEQCQSKKKL